MDKGAAQIQGKEFTELQMTNWTEEIKKKAEPRKCHNFIAWALRKEFVKRRNMRKSSP